MTDLERGPSSDGESAICASSLNNSSSTLVERLLSNAQLPVCPYDRRSPDYWTTPDDQPCVICGTLNDFSTPNLCRGADTRVMDEAAALILELQAELTFASVHAHDYARRALTAESALSRIQSETVEACAAVADKFATNNLDQPGEYSETRGQAMRLVAYAIRSLKLPDYRGGEKNDSTKTAECGHSPSTREGD